jgi:hypothetical protein
VPRSARAARRALVRALVRAVATELRLGQLLRPACRAIGAYSRWGCSRVIPSCELSTACWSASRARASRRSRRRSARVGPSSSTTPTRQSTPPGAPHVAVKVRGLYDFVVGGRGSGLTVRAPIRPKPAT